MKGGLRAFGKVKKRKPRWLSFTENFPPLKHPPGGAVIFQAAHTGNRAGSCAKDFAKKKGAVKKSGGRFDSLESENGNPRVAIFL